MEYIFKWLDFRNTRRSNTFQMSKMSMKDFCRSVQIFPFIKYENVFWNINKNIVNIGHLHFDILPQITEAHSLDFHEDNHRLLCPTFYI